MMNRVKTPAEIEAIRESGRILGTVLNLVTQAAVPGTTGAELANIAKKEVARMGGTAPFLGYSGFPNVICISINDAVIHGIPNNVVLQEGDVVGFDFGVQYKGMITDAARTVHIGTPKNPQTADLLKGTLRSLDAGISVIKAGVKTGDIGASIEAVLKKHNLGIVRSFVGHGVGHHVHEEPEVPNYGSAGTGSMLKAGMTIAVEPMATLGGEDIFIDTDGWTVKTTDGSLTAHFEDTILILDGGCEILTRV
jgi:methionyl aminopeptidase